MTAANGSRRSRAERRAGVRSRLGLAGTVALGGAVGALVRALLETAVPAGPGPWPWTTFWINVVGSLALGALLESLLHAGPDEGWRRTVRVGCGTGVLGGFTTYSSFAVEAVQLLEDGHMLVGLGYAVVSVVVGLLAALTGILLARAVARRRSAGGPSTRAEGSGHP